MNHCVGEETGGVTCLNCLPSCTHHFCQVVHEPLGGRGDGRSDLLELPPHVPRGESGDDGDVVAEHGLEVSHIKHVREFTAQAVVGYESKRNGRTGEMT